MSLVALEEIIIIEYYSPWCRCQRCVDIKYNELLVLFKTGDFNQFVCFGLFDDSYMFFAFTCVYSSL